MINIAQYFNPSKEIQEAVQKLGLYYQLLNQEKVDLVIQNSGKPSFSWKTLGELWGFDEMKEFCSITESNKWSYFLKSKFLLDKFSPELNTERLKTLTDDEFVFVGKTIREGLKARKVLEEWLKPLSGDALQALEDACTLDISNTFQILKISKLEETKKKAFSVYPYILEIQSAEEMLTFLKLQKEVQNCLIVTLQRNEEYRWKSMFYLFLIYKGTLYSIDNSERRLNLNNTEGCRNPDRYMERKYNKVWLPVDILEGEESKSRELVVKGAKVYKIASLEDYAKEAPGIIYWLGVFVDRLVDYIKNQEIPQGVMTMDLPKLLTYVNNNKLEIEDSGAGSYLEEIYASDCKDIVIQEKHLPKLVGTQEYVRDVIAYRKREMSAEALSKAVQNDYNKNSKKVYEKIRRFVRNWSVEDLLRRTLTDKEYSYMQYRHFGVQEKPDGLQKQKVFHMFDLENDYSSLNAEDKNNIININDKLYESSKRGQPHTQCSHCRKVKWKQLIILDFIDWRQFVEFFGITEKDIPIQMKQHLHQQLEMYVGNSILSDTDPVDELKDPWFRERESIMGGPLLRICIPVCNRCLNKGKRYQTS